MAVKQTAGREALGQFAPKFAQPDQVAAAAETARTAKDAVRKV